MEIKEVEFVDADGEVVDLDEITTDAEKVANDSDEEIVEEGQSHKKSHVEKKTLSMREKLLSLKEQLKNNPPKSMLGKKLAMARINRLENMMNRQIAKLAQKRNIEAKKGIASEKEIEEYEAYVQRDEAIRDEIGKVSLSKEEIIRKISILKGYDPSTNKYIYSEDDNRINKNAPKGYQPKVKEESNNDEYNILYIQLEEIENSIRELKDAQNKNHEQYEEARNLRKEAMKKDLAVVKPNIFKRIKAFIQDKKEKFNNWIQEKRTETENKYNATVSKVEKNDVKRDEMLGSLHSGLSLEEQKANSEQIVLNMAAKTEQPVRQKENGIGK